MGSMARMGPAPPLNDPLFLAIVPDAAVLQVIRAGRPVSPLQKSPMPGFAYDHGGPLTDAQIVVLAEGIKKRWGGERPKAPCRIISRPKGSKPGNSKAGGAVFSASCARCHGDLGKGGTSKHGPVGAINDPVFLSLISDQALRRIIITGRHDFGMPDYRTNGPDRRPLTEEQLANLVSLLASWRQGGSTSEK